ncbi:MAG TPA: HAMP domain-containing sensor histidine kinase [Anaeromyxobacter sp.]|nr:HAMP domain-containing sensor histidine kinase [Anaeromyxobacter sp.]
MSERSRTPRTDEAADADLLAPSLLHELRQPLTGADAAATLLERARPDLVRSDDWRLLRAQLARIAEIVNEYESLFRPGAATPERFEVGPAVARAVDLLSHRVRPLARRFGFERRDGGREGWGAPGAVVHAATNLLSNALEALDGRDDARVLVRVLGAAGGSVEVRVSDEGAGIAPAARERIFEPGFTTKGAERGTGLGLHVARRLMRRHGGEVFLVADADPERAPWAVTEFCISVPPPPAGGAA